MAYVTDHHATVGEILARPFVRFYDALARMAENDPRLVEARRLQSLSDGELAELGLTRDQIPAHAFRGAIHF